MTTLAEARALYQRFNTFLSEFGNYAVFPHDNTMGANGVYYTARSILLFFSQQYPHDAQVRNEYDFINKAILSREQQRELLPPEYHSPSVWAPGFKNYLQRAGAIFVTIKNLEPRLSQLETEEKQKVEAARIAATQAQQAALAEQQRQHIAEQQRQAALRAQREAAARQAEALRVQQAAAAARAHAEQLERQRFAEEQARIAVQKRQEAERQERIRTEEIQRYNEQQQFVDTILSERRCEYEHFFQECVVKQDTFSKERAALQRNLSFFESLDNLTNTNQTTQRQNDVNVIHQVSSWVI